LIEADLLAEALAVLDRDDEEFHDLRVNVIAVELVELRQPEVVAVEVRSLPGVGVAAQIAEVLRKLTKYCGACAAG
jgi:NADPH-dependent 7-cyano-7-deazaguanine reductase QueF